MTKKNALLIRMDRMGDLILSLPVDESPALADYDCHWLITQGLGFIPRNSVPERKYKSMTKSLSLLQCFHFYFWIRKLRPQISICFHAPWWVSIVLYLARVPKRIGVQSQWHSFLFLNKPIRQKRSLVENHELEYNFKLVENGLELPEQSTYSYLNMKTAGTKTLNRFGIIKKSYIVIHPGMGGSALNWPAKNYVNLIKLLVDDEHTVVLTGTSADDKYIHPIEDELNLTPNIKWLNKKLAPPELLEVLANAAAVVAPSTGVLHLAASLKVPTLGIFSSVKVESCKRWGPRGEKVTTVSPPFNKTPQGDSPEDKMSQLTSMQKVTPDEVITELIQLMQ